VKASFSTPRGSGRLVRGKSVPQACGTHGKSYGVSLERGAGSGDDGSFLRVFVGAIFARPITANVNSYERGYYYNLNFI
jgi:hypothetical protein